MSFSKIIHEFKLFFATFFDLLFPKSKNVEKLEKMTAEKWQHLTTPGEHEGVMFFFSYHEKIVRDAIWEIKYKRNKIILEKMVAVVKEFMLPEISEKILFENFKDVIITSVPQSRQRKNERGYNQGEDVGRALARGLSLPFSPLLFKTRDTPRQTTLKRSARLSNMKNSLAVRSDQNLSGKNIIIVDDVVTTGSTLNEAKKVLRSAGARKVLCIALAH